MNTFNFKIVDNEIFLQIDKKSYKCSDEILNILREFLCQNSITIDDKLLYEKKWCKTKKSPEQFITYSNESLIEKNVKLNEELGKQQLLTHLIKQKNIELQTQLDKITNDYNELEKKYSELSDDILGYINSLNKLIDGVKNL